MPPIHVDSPPVDSASAQKNLKAKSLSKYDMFTLNPLPSLNVAFGEGVRKDGWGRCMLCWAALFLAINYKMSCHFNLSIKTSKPNGILIFSGILMSGFSLKSINLSCCNFAIDDGIDFREL